MSVFSPGVKPAFPRAGVVLVGEPATQATKRAGEVIYGDGTLVRRYDPNAVLAVAGTPVRTIARPTAPACGQRLIVDHADKLRDHLSRGGRCREALRGASCADGPFLKNGKAP